MRSFRARPDRPEDLESTEKAVFEVCLVELFLFLFWWDTAAASG